MSQKKKNDTMQKLFMYAGKYRYLMILSWIMAFVSGIVALMPFYCIWKMIHEVLQNTGHLQNVSQYGWQAVGMALLAMIIYILALVCSHLSAFRIQANLRSSLMRHILKLPSGMMDKEGTGRLRKTINECSEATETYIAHQLPDKYVATATPVGLGVLLFVFDFRLGLLSLVPVVLGFLIMGTMMGENMKRKMVEYQNALEEMSNEAVEYVRGIPVVKTFGQTVFSFHRFEESIHKYEKWTISYTKDLCMPMIGYTVAINSVFAFLIAGAFLFGNIRSGSVDNVFLLNLLFYIIITPVITVTLTKMMYAGENAMVIEDAMNRMNSILEMKPLPESVKKEELKDSSVVFDHVTYRYEGNDTDALHDISFTVHPGEHVAFVGPSGGGKTTLAGLTVRFMDVSEGNVYVGGTDVRNIDQKELMDNVSYVFQDSRLLKTSIFENVRMGKKDATREEVRQALEDACCKDIIDKLPDGMDTIIGSSGTYLSGGEMQRISIARAMIKNAPILILDEATAFADPDNEAMVQKAFSRLSKGKTVIMIAHRLSSITDADKIYVLKEGRIAESGTHEELLIKKGMYAHMWNAYNHAVNWKAGELK